MPCTTVPLPDLGTHKLTCGTERGHVDTYKLMCGTERVHVITYSFVCGTERGRVARVLLSSMPPVSLPPSFSRCS
eukprot:109259-Rhodomonas_salina.1